MLRVGGLRIGEPLRGSGAMAGGPGVALRFTPGYSWRTPPGFTAEIPNVHHIADCVPWMAQAFRIVGIDT